MSSRTTVLPLRIGALTGLHRAALSLAALTVGALLGPPSPAAGLQAAERPVLSRVAHVGLVVRDADRAASAWADTFDVPRTPLRTVSPERRRLAEVRFDNLVLEFSEPIGGASPWRDFLTAHGEGIHHLAFEVPNLKDAGRALKQFGGRQTSGTGRASALFDFDNRMGGAIELVPAAADNPRNGRTPGTRTTIVALGHLTRDIEPARRFWGELLAAPIPEARDTKGVPFPADCQCDREAYIREVNIRGLTPGLNLIQPMGGTSVWRHLIEQHEGLAYLQFNLPDQASLDAMIASLLARGGVRTLGDTGAPYAYIDLQQTLGLTLLLVKSAPPR